MSPHAHEYTGPYCDCRTHDATVERDCCCRGKGRVCWEHPIMWCACGTAREPTLDDPPFNSTADLPKVRKSRIIADLRVEVAQLKRERERGRLVIAYAKGGDEPLQILLDKRVASATLEVDSTPLEVTTVGAERREYLADSGTVTIRWRP